MNRWEAKYYLVRTGRWIWQRTLTAILLALIVTVLVVGSWAASAVADQYGIDLMHGALILLGLSVGYWVLDSVLWA